MANVGDYTTKYGYISKSEAETGLKKIDQALSRLSSPDDSITVFGVLAMFFTNSVVSVIGFATAVFSLGTTIVKRDLNAQKSTYNTVREMYIGSSSITNVEVKQKYVYRLCQGTYGWYVYGEPKVTRFKTSSGWTSLT